MNAVADVRRLVRYEFEQVETRLDEEFGVYWGFMNPMARPCFNMGLLKDLRGYINNIVDTGGVIFREDQQVRVRYGVLASKTPGVFNLGGDLAMFRKAIDTQDREVLLTYGEACIDDLYPWYRNCDLPMTSMALVQGDALGGGFEAALCATVLIAEESARMGFPEILFNLFPGMGAYSFLSRRVGRRSAEEVITSGRIYSARELYDLGIVDVITPDGTGEAAVYNYVKRHSKSANGRRAFEQARNEVNPLTREELQRVVEIWATAALRLTERDLRMMDRLLRAQLRTSDCVSTTEGTPSNVIPLQAIGGSD